jgi:hypothetical protein
MTRRFIAALSDRGTSDQIRMTRRFIAALSDRGTSDQIRMTRRFIAGCAWAEWGDGIN